MKFNPVFDEIFFSSILWVCHLKSDKLLETIFEKRKSLFHQNLKITKRMLITILQDSAWLFFIHLEFFTYFGSANNQDYVNWSNIIQIKYRKIKAILPIQSLFFREIVEVINKLIVTCNIITTVTFASKCTQSSPNANSTGAKFH